MASGDRIAMDVEAIKVISGFEGSTLRDNPWMYTQIQRAKALDLGVKSQTEYSVVTG